MNPDLPSQRLTKTSLMNENILLLNNMPFSNITNIELTTEFQSVTERTRQKLDQCNLNDYLCKNLSKEISENIDCKYYNESSFNQLLKTCNPELSILHLNIRSLNKHRAKLTSFLETLDKEFDIIALTEIGKLNIENNLAFFEN